MFSHFMKLYSYIVGGVSVSVKISYLPVCMPVFRSSHTQNLFSSCNNLLRICYKTSIHNCFLVTHKFKLITHYAVVALT